MPFGLLGYPVLMAADILLPRADLVPVGADNRGNVELARELARRFNHMYGEVFPIPELELEDTLVGTDGLTKMSKSLDNAIYLSDSSDAVEEKVRGMFTDPGRISPDTPGNIKGNPVFDYHDAFNFDEDEVRDLKERYLEGKVGDVEVKEKLAAAINQFLDPIRTRRDRFAHQPGFIMDILSAGSDKMNEESRETLDMVRDAMGLQQYKTINESNGSIQEPAKVLSGLAFL